MSSPQVLSLRPAQQELAVPFFVASVSSSPANVYLQEVQAQSHDERRFSWVFRSPNSGLLLSPLAYGVFRIKVTAPYKLSREDMVGSLQGAFDTQHTGNAATTGATLGVALRAGYGYRPLLCFGEGNCVQNATESLSISVNGATWTELNANLYSRSLDRCFVPLDVQQRSYSTCGGPCSAFDDKPISGSVLGLPDNLTQAAHGAGINNLVALAAADGTTESTGYRSIEGMTCDSSVAKRMDNFYDQIIESSAITAAAHEVTLEIRFPIMGCVFNSLWGATGLSRTDPRLKMALGIANYNQGQITYNFKDMIKHLVRRLGRPSRLAAASTLAGSVAGLVASDITVTYDTTYTPRLHLTWVRLPAFRSYPQSSALAIYRRDVRRPVEQIVGTKSFDAGLFDKAGNKFGLQCASGLSAQPSALTIRPASAGVQNIKTKHEVDVTWNGIQFPQIPNQIFIVMQKSSDVYNLQNPCFGVDTVGAPAAGDYSGKWETAAARGAFDTFGHANAVLMDHAAAAGNAGAEVIQAFNQEVAGRYLAQNQASNASIMQLEIVVQSAIGSFSFKSSAYPYTQDRDMLWQKHCQNCNDQYMKAGRGRWQDRSSCAFLGCADFLLGLSSSPGTVYPIILDIKAKFANRAAVSSGLCFSNGQAKGKQVLGDIMVGDPVIVACFNQQIISIASSSAVISAQAFSQSTTAAALSQRV